MTGVDIAAHASEAGGASPLPTGPVETGDHSTPAAAGSFSEALADTRAREMTMARVDPFIVVRIENHDRHEDLLLHIDTASSSSEEVPCLAVST